MKNVFHILRPRNRFVFGVMATGVVLALGAGGYAFAQTT